MATVTTERPRVVRPTENEKEVLMYLLEHEGRYIRASRSRSGREYFQPRIFADPESPCSGVFRFSARTLNNLISKSWIYQDYSERTELGSSFLLTPTGRYAAAAALQTANRPRRRRKSQIP